CEWRTVLLSVKASALIIFAAQNVAVSNCGFTSHSISFEGFAMLAVLELRNILLHDTQSQLRFRCPLLTTLILDSCYGYLTYPCIVVEEAPILECLYLTLLAASALSC
ncbi:hypothetical protein LINPERHAP2_LOCUS33996, partial [Linum perenne]